MPAYLTHWLIKCYKEGRCNCVKYHPEIFTYRDTEPSAYWRFMSFYGVLDIALIIWATYLSLLAFGIIPCK